MSYSPIRKDLASNSLKRMLYNSMSKQGDSSAHQTRPESGQTTRHGNKPKVSIVASLKNSRARYREQPVQVPGPQGNNQKSAYRPAQDQVTLNVPATIVNRNFISPTVQAPESNHFLIDQGQPRFPAFALLDYYGSQNSNQNYLDYSGFSYAVFPPPTFGTR